MKTLTMILLAMTLVSCSSSKKSSKACCHAKKCDSKKCKTKKKCCKDKKCNGKSCKMDKKKDVKMDTETQAKTTTNVSEASSTADAPSANAGTVTCTLNNDSRTIALNTMDTGCEVVYTKFGESNSVATDSSGTDYCQTVSDRIQNNLENAGFTCK